MVRYLPNPGFLGDYSALTLFVFKKTSTFSNTNFVFTEHPGSLRNITKISGVYVSRYKLCITLLYTTELHFYSWDDLIRAMRSCKHEL